jgi:hypothetical protein
MMKVFSMTGAVITGTPLEVDRFFDTEDAAEQYGVAVAKKWVDDHM